MTAGGLQFAHVTPRSLYRTSSYRVSRAAFRFCFCFRLYCCCIALFGGHSRTHKHARTF